ncbi:hypothetical protein [Yoonia sp. SDW83-1]|uniref:hypothetical protein n=1 Tax=Yoonia sp. SDW83-1 TaxID=3366945 RepID=UPI00398C5B4D
MIITSAEWVLLALATVALIHGAVICMNLRKNLSRAEARQGFQGLSGALSDVHRRAGRKTPES